MSNNNNIDNIALGLSSENDATLNAYYDLIVKYNQKLNLVSKSAVADLKIKHFADSILALKNIPFPESLDSQIMDFGSGNGFPGAIAAILFPHLRFLLVERDLRKSEFLKLLKSHLKLQNLDVFGGDLRDLPSSSCELAMSRAMSPVSRFLDETFDVSAPGASLYLLKAQNWKLEMDQVTTAQRHHWNVQLQSEYTLPGEENSTRVVILCKKRG